MHSYALAFFGRVFASFDDAFARVNNAAVRQAQRFFRACRSFDDQSTRAFGGSNSRAFDDLGRILAHALYSLGCFDGGISDGMVNLPDPADDGAAVLTLIRR